MKDSIGFQMVSRENFYRVKAILGKFHQITTVGDGVSAYRSIFSIAKLWADQGLLSSANRNQIRFQVDGMVGRTDQGKPGVSCYICLVAHKPKVGTSGEILYAFYNDDENSENFRRYLQPAISELQQLVENGFIYEKSSTKFDFELAICADYVALVKVSKQIPYITCCKYL